jgi:hypothetical protein
VKRLTIAVGVVRLRIAAADLLADYREMSQDRTREAEAEEWIEGLIEDATPQPE